MEELGIGGRRGEDCRIHRSSNNMGRKTRGADDTQRMIAERAGTSLKTVSRVINRDPLVNAETRARIEAIIGELGYTPSQAARMMRSQKSNVIGFLSIRSRPPRPRSTWSGAPKMPPERPASR